MQYPLSGVVTLRTNLAEYPVTKALRQGRISSSIVSFDFCGPPTAHDENADPRNGALSSFPELTA